MSRASSARCWSQGRRQFLPAPSNFLRVPALTSPSRRRTSRRFLRNLTFIAVAHRPSFPDASWCAAFTVGATVSRSRKGGLSCLAQLVWLQRSRSQACCRARRIRGDRCRSRGDSRRDPATQGILRSAHPGARATAEGSRSQARDGTAQAARRRRHAPSRLAAAPTSSPAALAARSIRRSRRCCRACTRTCRRIRRIRDRRLRPERRHRPAKRGFSIGESELALSANVDDKFSGNPIFSLTPENTDRGRGSLRHVHRDSLRLHAEIRTLPLRHRLPERAAPARLGFLRRAARRTRRFSAASSRATACSSSGWRRPIISSSSAARSATARAFPARDATRTASARRRLRPRGRRHRREPQLARGLSYLQTAAERSRVRADRPRGQRGAARLFRQEPARDRRLRLEMGAERQRDGDQLQAAGRVFLAQGERRSHLRRRRRARPHQHVDLLVAAERLVPRRASTSSCRTGASARATTGSTRAASTTAPTASTSRRIVQSAALLGDARLHAVGVQPLPRAVAAKQGAARASPTTSSSCNTS